MELAEAISILEDENQEISDITTGINEKWKEAYKTVIQISKNSIPKEKVEKKIEIYKRLELEGFNRDSIQADEYRAIIKVLQELLEEQN